MIHLVGAFLAVIFFVILSISMGVWVLEMSLREVFKSILKILFFGILLLAFLLSLGLALGVYNT